VVTTVRLPGAWCRIVGLGILASAAAGTAQVPAAGRRAPDLTLKTLAESSVRLAQFRGRPLVVNFWATWCKPCRAEMPMLVAAHDRHRVAGLQILAVNLRDQERGRDVQRFVEEFRLPFPVLLDAHGRARRAFRVRAIPTTIFIDSAGLVRLEHPGPLTEELLQRGIAAILPASTVRP
jgi:thiol-disulfide isomerase/thioredoxin